MIVKAKKNFQHELLLAYEKTFEMISRQQILFLEPQVFHFSMKSLPESIAQK
jgi:hypothetical protein